MCHRHALLVTERETVCHTVAVSASLNGGHQSPPVTESDVEDSFDVAMASDFLFQQALDDVDGSCVQGLTGLYNHGNTCYINATIQALSNWYVFTGVTLHLYVYACFNEHYCSYHYVKMVVSMMLIRCTVYCAIGLSHISLWSRIFRRHWFQQKLSSVCYHQGCHNSADTN